MGVWLVGALFVVAAILVGMLPALLLRKRFSGLQEADTRAVASDVMARIGVMRGLILSLVFASAHGGAQKFDDDMTAARPICARRAWAIYVRQSIRMASVAAAQRVEHAGLGRMARNAGCVPGPAAH